MTTNNGRTPSAKPTIRLPFRSKPRRRMSGLLALGVALIGTGAIYAGFTPSAQTAEAAADPKLVQQGEQLFNNNCQSCHGDNLQGIQDRGPSLVGVGEAAVYFQVSTGRMPMARQEAQAERKPVKFTPEQIDALGAYVQSKGGGKVLPEERGKALRGDNPARGGELFRLNCSNCHGPTGGGGALSSGKFAPPLDKSTEEQIYAAMLTGPQNMPVFSDRQLSPEEKKDIIAYIKSITEANAPGGNSLGGLGTGPEAVIAWIVGLAALVGVTLWIGSKV